MADVSTDYDWGRYTPVDNTGTNRSVFKSAYKNIRFAIPFTSTYVITESDLANLAGMAYKLYADVSLWRVLLTYNGLQDPIQEVYPGMVLKVPAKADIIAYMSAQQNNQLPAFVI